MGRWHGWGCCPKRNKMNREPKNKSLRRRLIAYGVVAGLLLVVFLLRLGQLQLWG